MKYLNINIYIIATFLIGLSACGETKESQETISINSNEDNKIEVSNTQFESAKMELTSFSQKPFSDQLLVNGKLDVPPEYKAAVSAYFGGYVKNISILPGQYIKKGQTLFTLENPDFVRMQEEYLAQKSQLDFLQNDFERKKALYEEKVSSEKDYLKAKADYESVKAKMASLAKQLQLININTEGLTAENIRSVVRINSPIAGYINDVHAERGKYLEPKDIAVMITNPDHIHIELNIYEKDYDKLIIGQSLTFQLQNKPSINYQGSIYLINRYIENQQRIVKVHGHLLDDETSKELIPGMYLEAQITTQASEKTALPEASVINLENDYYVLMLEQASDSIYSFSKKKVEVDGLTNGYYAIKNADMFKHGTKFLAKGTFNLLGE